MGAEQQDHIHPRKKIKATTREPNGAAFLLRCSELGLVHDDVLGSYTMGMVYDLLSRDAKKVIDPLVIIGDDHAPDINVPP